MTVIFDEDGEPVRTHVDHRCELFDSCEGPATAKVCGSDCKCRVNVCAECSAFMDGRFKCPFTGQL